MVIEPNGYIAYKFVSGQPIVLADGITNERAHEMCRDYAEAAAPDGYCSYCDGDTFYHWDGHEVNTLVAMVDQSQFPMMPIIASARDIA